tara:strand:- start:623 stop:928 length:306 start_codon:yes stop_codon:yes gene_type:complete
MDRSDAYVMTAYTACAGDMLEIDTIRNVVKSINKQNRIAEKRHNNHPMNDDLATFPQYRVSLKGRYGRNNPNYCPHRGNNGSVPLEHAERVDVYIHRRNTW